jgi:hypothetical protein
VYAGVVSLTACELIGNLAGMNGGAVYTDAGAFINMSATGFIENVAVQSGAAWFGFGSQAVYIDSTTKFDNNTASCCYASGYGSALLGSTSATCTDTDTGEGASDCCNDEQYSNGVQCVPCLEGADCSVVGSTLASQALVPGYWRLSTNTTDVRKCWVPEACVGNNEGTDSGFIGPVTSALTSVKMERSYCAPGYQGPCKSTHASFMMHRCYSHSPNYPCSLHFHNMYQIVQCAQQNIVTH